MLSYYSCFCRGHYLTVSEAYRNIISIPHKLRFLCAVFELWYTTVFQPGYYTIKHGTETKSSTQHPWEGHEDTAFQLGVAGAPRVSVSWPWGHSIDQSKSIALNCHWRAGPPWAPNRLSSARPSLESLASDLEVFTPAGPRSFSPACWDFKLLHDSLSTRWVPDSQSGLLQIIIKWWKTTFLKKVFH